ncbi:hypothetical protein SprV_0501799700 [Sparganum proliferum]
MLTRNRGRPTSFVANLGLLRKNKKRVPKSAPIVRKKPGRPRKHELHEITSTSGSVSVLKIAKNVQCTRKKYVDVKEEQPKLSSTGRKIGTKLRGPKSSVSKRLALRHAAMRSIAAKKLQRRAALIENLRKYREKKKLIKAGELAEISTAVQNNVSAQAPKKRGRKPKPKPEIPEHTTLASSKYVNEVKIDDENFAELAKMPDDHTGSEAVKDVSSNEEAPSVTTEIPIDINKTSPVSDSSVSPNAGFVNECGRFVNSSKSPLREIAVSRQELLLSMNCGFRSFDDVLQEILGEISKTGVVFSSKRQFLQSRSNLCDSDEQEQDNAIFIFSNPTIGNLLEKIGPVSVLNKELDAKDALLASVGLARPGVREALRKRREEKAKQLNRSAMGRLRPNPRPRRYSDMITQKKSLDVTHLPPEAYVPSSDLQPRGFRDSVVKAKLVQTKARELTLAGTAPKLHERQGRGRPRKSSLAVSQLAKVTEVRPIHPSVSTRPRRRLDVRHHIEWKFCYGGNERKSQNPSLHLRKRRHAVLSPDQHPESLQANEEDYEEETLTHDNLRDSESYVDVREGDKVAEIEASQTVECALDGEAPGSDTFSPVNKQSSSRRRHHSILFQRKRPVAAGRTPSEDSLERPEGPSSFMKSHRLRSPSSDSSSSQSGFRRGYERPFRNGRSSLKYDGPTASEYSKSSCDSHFRTEAWSAYVAKHQGSRKLKPVEDAVKTDDHGQTCRSRRISPGRRLLHHKHDQMRRLTLLDRVVLGLTCSVSQEGDQIHIKQLHAEDLNILTQRLTETGFFIQSLALKTNANNEAEYNIVLTYAPNFDAESRRFHRFNSPSSREHNEAAPRTVLHSVTQTRDRDVSPSNSAYLDPSKSFSYKKNSEFGNQARDHGLQAEINGRGSSDPAAAVDGARFSAAHSDDDELLSLSSKRLHDANRAASPPRPSSSSEVHPSRRSFDPGFTQSVEEARKKLGREPVLGVRQRYPRMRPNFHSLKYSSLRKKHGAYRSLHSKRQSSQRPRSFQYGEKLQERRKSRGGYQYRSDDSDSHLRSNAPCPDTLHPQPPHRPAASSLLHAEAGDPVSYIPALSIMFRRHSPRKLIRKVYTGTSTVPKILNRKRPTIPVTVSASTNQTAAGAAMNEGSSTLMAACSTTAIPSPTLVVPQKPSSVMTMNAAAAAAATVGPQAPAPLVPSPSTRPVALSVLDQPHLVGRPPSASMTPPNAILQAGPVQTADVIGPSAPTAVAITASEDPVTVDRTLPFLATKVQAAKGDAQNPKSDSAVAASTSVLYFPSKMTHQRVEPSTTELAASNTPGLSTALKSGVPTKTMPLISICESPPSNTVARIQSPAKKRPFTPSGSAVETSDVVKDESVLSDQRSREKTVIESEKSGLGAGDDVYNPAISMSASQLLKLKRMHDEPSRPGVGEPHRLYSRNQVLAHQLTSSQTRLPANQPKLTKMSQSAAPTTAAAAAFPRPVSAADVGAATDEEAGANFELESVLARCLPSHPSPSHPPPAISSHDSGSGQSVKLPFSPANAAAAAHHHHHILAQSLAASSSLPTPIVTSQVSPGKVFSVRGLLPQLTPASASPRPFSTNVLHYVPGLHPVTAVRQSHGSPFPDHTTGRLSVTTPACSALSSLKISESNSIPATYLSGRPIFSTGAVTTTTMTLSGGKRPIVHKYHSFRKISPKTEDPIAAAGKRVDPDATQKPGGLHPSQLLKSLLECGGASRETVTSATPAATTPTTTASTSAVMPGIPVGSGSSVWNQPAHHSRGTWQLGGRAVVLGATRASAVGPSGLTPPRAGPVNRVPPISAAAMTPPPATTAPKMSPEPAVTPCATSMLSTSPSTISTAQTGSHEELLSSDAVPQAALHETIES